MKQEASIQSSGKRPRDAYMGQQVTPATVGPQDINVITPVAAVSMHASVAVGSMGGVRMEMMLDSGSSVDHNWLLRQVKS